MKRISMALLSVVGSALSSGWARMAQMRLSAPLKSAQDYMRGRASGSKRNSLSAAQVKRNSRKHRNRQRHKAHLRRRSRHV